MNKAVHLLENPESRCDELEQYATSSLEDGVSVAAVDDHGEFVGMVINGIAKREVRTDELLKLFVQCVDNIISMT